MLPLLAMTCALLSGAALVRAQKATPPAPAADQADDQKIDPGQLPPDEDKASVKEQYAFNPVQSTKDVTVGEEYFKKGNFRAAAARFLDATKWNDGNAQAWLRLGDAQAKMNDSKAAREAWEKYLQLAPEAKNAAEVKKKLEKLKS
jgi:tetratricopeptide (TPR) repeat protein